MMRADELLFGCFDSTVVEVLSALRGALPQFTRVLVRCLDSQRDPVAVAAVFTGANIPFQTRAEGVTIAAGDLDQAVRSEVFCGFDELWILTSSGLQVPIPEGMRLTSDGGPIGTSEAREVAELMKKNSVSLVLADGCGVNCITFDRRFWSAVVSKWAQMVTGE
jgi:hypothetical protein